MFPIISPLLLPSPALAASVRRAIHLPLLFCCVCGSSLPAVAQRVYAFPGIPWRTSADLVRAQLEPRGFVYSGEIEHGDLAFARADGAQLRVELQDGRAVGFLLVDSAHARAAEPRYQGLGDSLQAALGKPDTVAQDFLMWEAGLTAVGVERYYRLGVHHVQLVWRGPGWFDEAARRHRLPEFATALPAGYTTVAVNFISRVAVDTAHLVRLPANVLRGRFRLDYVHPVGPAEDQFDAAEYEMELDCAGKRTRLIARTIWLKAQVRHTETHQRLPWTTPQPGGHEERGLDAVCRAAATLHR